MRCPSCSQNDNYRVIRTLKGTDGVVRHLECLECGYVFFTAEAPFAPNVPPQKKVVKEAV